MKILKTSSVFFLHFVFFAISLLSIPFFNELYNVSETRESENTAVAFITLAILSTVVWGLKIIREISYLIEDIKVNKKIKIAEDKHNIKILDDFSYYTPILVENKSNKIRKYIILTPILEKNKIIDYKIQEMVMKNGGYLPEEDPHLANYQTNFLGTFKN